MFHNYTGVNFGRFSEKGFKKNDSGRQDGNPKTASSNNEKTTTKTTFDGRNTTTTTIKTAIDKGKTTTTTTTTTISNDGKTRSRKVSVVSRSNGSVPANDTDFSRKAEEIRRQAERSRARFEQRCNDFKNDSFFSEGSSDSFWKSEGIHTDFDKHCERMRERSKKMRADFDRKFEESHTQFMSNRRW